SGGTVLAGGMLDLLAGAVFSGVTVNSGGILEVGSGFTLDGAGNFTTNTVSGIIKVDASGVTSNLIISAGMQEIVSANGTANATTVRNSGSLVLSGGTASGAVLSA